MHTEYTKVSRRLGWLLLVLALVGLLAACSTVTNVTMPEAPDQFAYTLTVEVAADAVKEAVEADYGGTAVVFRPEAGFAILGMTEGVVDASQELTAARHRTKTTTSSATSMESNTSTFFVPEVAASGFTSWSGGFTSWSGGFPAGRVVSRVGVAAAPNPPPSPRTSPCGIRSTCPKRNSCPRASEQARKSR